MPDKSNVLAATLSDVVSGTCWIPLKNGEGDQILTNIPDSRKPAAGDPPASGSVRQPSRRDILDGSAPEGGAARVKAHRPRTRNRVSKRGVTLPPMSETSYRSRRARRSGCNRKDHNNM